MTTTEPREFWERRYRTAEVTEVSWFEATPAFSLQILDAAGVATTDSVLDVGGGASALVETLWQRGHRDLTVVDASPAAMEIARGRWPVGDQVTWVEADLLEWEPDRWWDVWHDRAVFHFLTGDDQRTHYRDLLRRALAPGGVVAIAGFAEDGPATCSGLEVCRHTPAELLDALGDGVEEVASGRYGHVTPSGAVQAFSWVVGRLHPRA